MKRIILSIFASLTLFSLNAQIFSKAAVKDGRYTNRLSPDDIKKIDGIVAPAREKLKATVNDGSGTYDKFLQEVAALKDMKSNKQRDAAAAGIIERYTSFFNTAWKKAGIEEQSLQQQIRAALPQVDPAALTFTSFLSFKIIPRQKPAPGSPAPAPPACINIGNIATGKVAGSTYLISGNGGSYSSNSLKSDSWSTVAGDNSIDVTLNSNVRIPGTFPNDSKKLHYRATYSYDVSGTAFGVVGTAFVLATRSSLVSDNWVDISLFAPVLWVTTQHQYGDISEEIIIPKNVAPANYFVSGNACSILPSASWTHSEITNLTWTVCEE